MTLTDRQIECLRGVLQHKTAKEIGRDLGISNHAVEQHLKVARKKLGAARTIDAARLFAANDINALTSVPTTAKPYYALSEVSEAASPSLVREDATELDIAPLIMAQPSKEGPAYDLTPLQTLAAIGFTALGIIVALTLILAVAQGIEQLVS